MNIAAVVSYSSYHNLFILPLLTNLSGIASEIVVVSFDQFFDGSEDNALLTLPGPVTHIHAKYVPGHSARWHHNQQRLLGYKALKGTYDAVMFLDSDEVPISKVCKQWLSTNPAGDYKLSAYWYYRDTCYQADQLEEGPVLVSNSSLQSADWDSPLEREGFSSNWQRMAMHKGKVLAHHYSWANTKELLLQKVTTWGHRDDNVDWEQIVRDEFANPFSYFCPFKPYFFSRVKPYVGFTINE